MSMTAPLRQYNQQRRQYQYMYNQQVRQTIGNAARAGLTVAGTLALGMPGGTIVNAAGKKVTVSLGHKLASYGMTDPISAMNTGVNTVGQPMTRTGNEKHAPHCHVHNNLPQISTAVDERKSKRHGIVR